MCVVVAVGVAVVVIVVHVCTYVSFDDERTSILSIKTLHFFVFSISFKIEIVKLAGFLVGGGTWGERFMRATTRTL